MENQFDLPHKGKHALTDMWSYQKLGGGGRSSFSIILIRINGAKFEFSDWIFFFSFFFPDMDTKSL